MLVRLIERLAALNPDAGEIATIVSEARQLRCELPALIELLDRDVSYGGPDIVIRCASHADALGTMRDARRVLGL